jgi:hypothetical protein
MTFLVWLLLLHFIGDFVLQNNWMAHNKSKHFLPLISHVGIYTLTLFVGTFWLSPAFAIVNGLLHLVIDYYTSRINASLAVNPDCFNLQSSLGNFELRIRCIF